MQLTSNGTFMISKGEEPDPELAASFKEFAEIVAKHLRESCSDAGNITAQKGPIEK